MLKRYTKPVMLDLWDREETKFEYWLKVELAFLHARATRGDIPMTAFEAIRDNAKINVARMKEIEEEVQHDMIAFVTMIQESLVAAGVGQHKERFHELLTSYNTEDPAQMLMLNKAVEYIIDELQNLRRALRDLAAKHMDTYMIMRSHGQFAEPSTFAHLVLVFDQAIERGIIRLAACRDNDLSDGNISGAVGSYGEIDPELEKEALRLLGLKPAKAETQILQRDRHAALLSSLAIVGSSIGQMCRTFWEMCRSEIRELQEPRSARQKGSSAMAHKKNPIGLEQLMGLPRKLRGDAHAAMEDIETPECRDISQSSVERHILPDVTSLVHYMAVRATGIVRGLVVFPDRMTYHLEVATRGTWAGQPVRTALMGAGVEYETAYRYVQAASFEAMDRERDLLEVVTNRPLSETDQRTAAIVLGTEKLAKCFDYREYVGSGVRHIYKANKLI